MKLTIVRSPTSDSGTFGETTLPNGVIVFSGELPDKNDAPDVSCVPCGIYPCLWAYSPHFQRELYHVQNVPGRDSILIHPANFMGDVSKGFRSDLEGCIALGMATSSIRIQRIGQQTIFQKVLTRSREAITAFESLMGKQPFDLEIVYL